MYTLYKGDSAEVMTRFPINSIDLVVTSPPYYSEKWSMDATEYTNLVTGILDQTKPLLKEHGSMWVILGDDPRNRNKGYAKRVFTLMQLKGWKHRDTLFWNKESGRVTPTFQANADMVVQYSINEPYHTPGMRVSRTEFTVPLSKQWLGSDTLAYPVELIKVLISPSIPAWGTVLDPFVGTGSTILAAEELQVHSIGIDLSESELSIAKFRLSHAAAKKPETLLKGKLYRETKGWIASIAEPKIIRRKVTKFGGYGDGGMHGVGFANEEDDKDLDPVVAIDSYPDISTNKDLNDDHEGNATGFAGEHEEDTMPFQIKPPPYGMCNPNDVPGGFRVR